MLALDSPQHTAFELSRHLLHPRLRQLGLGSARLGERAPQLLAQGAQFGDAGDDAGLFGEGGKPESQIRYLLG